MAIGMCIALAKFLKKGSWPEPGEALNAGKGTGLQMPPAPDHVHSGFLEEAGPTLLITLSPQLWNSRYGNVSYGFPEIDLCIHIKDKKFWRGNVWTTHRSMRNHPLPFQKTYIGWGWNIIGVLPIFTMQLWPQSSRHLSRSGPPPVLKISEKVPHGNNIANHEISHLGILHVHKAEMSTFQPIIYRP